MSNTIDETAFVEAPSNQSSLCFADEKQQARFELGVSMIIYSWDALDIAVANQWGGVDSAEKRDWITGIIVDLFKQNKIVDIVLVEETLLFAMVDEFETNVEDDTGLVIAAEILKLYQECEALDYTRVEALYLKWLEREKNGTENQRIVHVHGDADSSSENEDGSEEENDIPILDAGDSFPKTVPEPIVDDDGFELVQKKGKKDTERFQLKLCMKFIRIQTCIIKNEVHY
ncbi:hypothetical protein KAFR_0A05580 [Kazachstania africana CBS 2517]|uniref:Pre-rRNA-processing protein TSR2 n=1 Tax=Kazachstania africana (strain ATCC 22294 / BCRC 22015 / CBS 2517 / CECT 1963 / NBRC 1671 / NRRL Y-8276) TaxID=1071382 RepID=H2ANP3_KAZAF|nr:hypothetical protein KAFR_0A05580 [Kazachstania africana CBS 2517]CCF55993.1 hypothetical protein KAFR_0A05580 [Kazachstania africana CBS 2517]